MCLPAIGLFEVILNTFTQNDDFICILYSILFSLANEFGTKTRLPFFAFPVYTVDCNHYSFSEHFG